MTRESDDAGYDRVGQRYYDRCYAELRDPIGDAAWYAELARECGGAVLELGVGTGRVLLPIARAGIPCTGLDSSQAMLEALRRKDPPSNLELVHARMQDFDLGDRRFALVFSAFRAFQHLTEVADQLSCLACVRRHLAPGGAFAFDVFVPSLERTAVVHEPEQEDGRFEESGGEVRRYTRVDRDLARQVMHLAMRYERRRHGRVLSEERVRFDMRYFFRYELEHLLARAGFGDVRLYGDYEGAPFGNESREFVIVARE